MGYKDHKCKKKMKMKKKIYNDSNENIQDII